MKGFTKEIDSWATVVAYVAPASPGLLLPPAPRLERAALQASSWSKRNLGLFGAHKQVRGECAREPGTGVLVVANHTSYLDALVLAAIRPSHFVTSNDVGGVGLMGILTRLARRIHVERRTHTRLRRDVKAIAARLAAGFTIVLFPEGTSTDGRRIPPPFKSRSSTRPCSPSAPSIPPASIASPSMDSRPTLRCAMHSPFMATWNSSPLPSASWTPQNRCPRHIPRAMVR